MAVRRAPSPLPHRQPPSRRPSRRGARHLLAARVLLEAGAAEAHVAIGLAEVLRAPLSALEAHLYWQVIITWSSPWRSSDATCTLGEGPWVRARAQNRDAWVRGACLARAGAPIAGVSRRGSILAGSRTWSFYNKARFTASELRTVDYSYSYRGGVLSNTD